MLPKEQLADLSSPEGLSINDGIDKALCSLSYISVDDIAADVISLGRGALIAKTDVKHAYRQIPVHPEDRPLLGMRWKGQFYMDAVLPFGLRSAPLIFTAVADALQWIVQSRSVHHIHHYIDDFVVLGPPNSEVCSNSLLTLSQTCSELGVILANEKTEGPATCLTVLGIEIDSAAMELRLPADKLTRLAGLLEAWHGRKAGIRRDLESLVGMLQHASKVVRPGRIFLRRIYDLLAATNHFKPHFTVRLNRECRADIDWWHRFIRSWNGTSLLRQARALTPDVHLWSDASGHWGCGAHWQGLWFNLPWGSLPIAAEPIAGKELFPILVTSMLWGNLWKGCTVCCHCDNIAVVEVVNRQSAKNPLMSHLMRCLFFASAQFDFDMVARHIPGSENDAADALSRNKLPLFLSQMPHMAHTPTPIPVQLAEGLSQAHPHWDADKWMSWFSSMLTML